MVNSYTTTQGDAWDSIAYKLWGEERLAHILMQANPEHMDVLLFPAGIVLAVPPRTRQPRPVATLPPWAATSGGNHER